MFQIANMVPDLPPLPKPYIQSSRLSRGSHLVLDCCLLYICVIPFCNQRLLRNLHKGLGFSVYYVVFQICALRRVQGLILRDWGLGFGIWDLGFEI